ncbi:histidine kinase [Elysia marginata]|uniref:Histidine kinase n=1 Tax=Elysia marginata TaxID=1093978 RepID=A0AAV4HBM2_9GAST|nr:histidine kinase [Elysia marginata]
MVAEGMLEQLGYQVTTARNGQQCLDRCQKALFDLVLMDCNMPVMDGYEACRQLRNNAKTCDIPVVALTANALSHDRERCYRAGMQDYIAKPFDRSTLKQTLEKWL